MNERRGERKAIGPLSLKSQRESVRSSDAGSGGPHSALRPPPRPRLHEEVGLPKERAGNPAPRLSLGSASPPPAQAQRPDPHLVSKYTLGGCQESGGIAAIAKLAETSRSNCYFRRFAWDPIRRVPAAAAHTSGSRHSPLAMPKFGCLRRGRGRTPTSKDENPGCKAKASCPQGRRKVQAL